VVGDEGRRAAGRHADADAGLQIRMIIPTPDLNLSTPKWGPKQIMIPNGTKFKGVNQIASKFQIQHKTCRVKPELLPSRLTTVTDILDSKGRPHLSLTDIRGRVV
jgi:hypothetical protein